MAYDDVGRASEGVNCERCKRAGGGTQSLQCHKSRAEDVEGTRQTTRERQTTEEGQMQTARRRASKATRTEETEERAVEEFGCSNSSQTALQHPSRVQYHRHA
jgi:hypothetical protein